MAVDSDAILQGAAIPPECGEYLEYDPDFLAAQQATLGKSEQQFGDTIIPAESPDWNQVDRLGRALLERSLDIRVLILLARAGLERQGLVAWESPMRCLRDGLEQHWDRIHPRLEIDEEHDPMMRINALAELGDVAGMTRALRNAVLFQDAGVVLTIREVEAMLEGTARADAAMAFPGGKHRLLALLQAGVQAQDERLAALLAVHSHLDRIGEAVRTRLGVSWMPDFSALAKPLTLIAEALRTRQDAATLQAETAAMDAVAAPMPSPPAERQATPAAFAWKDVSVQSRQDAALLLEKARSYFETHESSHPASLLILRVEQLLPLDFYQLVQQLAPQGCAALDVVTPRPPAQQSG